MLQLIRKIELIRRVLSIYINWSLETIWLKLGDTLKDENNLSFEKSEKSDLIGQNHYLFCYMGPIKLMDSDQKESRHQNS